MDAVVHYDRSGQSPVGIWADSKGQAPDSYYPPGSIYVRTGRAVMASKPLSQPWIDFWSELADTSDPASNWVLITVQPDADLPLVFTALAATTPTAPIQEGEDVVE